MLTINGKTLITTDWHFGLKSNSEKRRDILISVTKSITSYAKENGVENLIFAGDWHHSRSNISIDTMTVSLKCMEALSRYIKNIYLILGNHDIFNKSSVDVNSMQMFKHIKNVTLIKESTECIINNSKCLMVPWLGRMNFPPSTFDMMIGHFDIDSGYVRYSYIEEAMRRNEPKEEVLKMLESDELLRESGLDLEEDFENIEDTFLNREKSSDLIGVPVDIVKEGGTIFSGHIHNHREFFTKSRKFIFIGSPYQTTRGEMTSNDGFYILNDDFSYEFHELTNIPRFIDIKMSDIVSNIDGFNYDIARNNIVHRIYDVPVSRIDDARICGKINEVKPFEEIPPDYRNTSHDLGTDPKVYEMIGKSPMEYLRSYVSEMSDDALLERKSERNKLVPMIEDLYSQVTE